MAIPGIRQVTGARLMLAAAGLIVLAACGGNCEARLTVLNASGLAVASGTLEAPGGRKPAALGGLPSPGSREYRFPDLAEGSYAFDIRFVDGSSRRDSLGYLTHGMGFRDTLVLHPVGAEEPLTLKQAPGPCREAPRMKTVIRQILKRALRT
jgi:hypothetical protein